MAYSLEDTSAINHYRKVNSRLVNKSKFPNSCIYIFQLDDAPCFKIGVSNNVKRRLSDINNANPFKVKRIYSSKLLTNGLAYDLEEYIHNKLKDAYLKNEWFELDPTSIKFIIKEIRLWQHQRETNFGN